MEGLFIVIFNSRQFVTVKDGDRIMSSIDYDQSYPQSVLKGEWLGLSDNKDL